MAQKVQGGMKWYESNLNEHVESKTALLNTEWNQIESVDNGTHAR